MCIAPTPREMAKLASIATVMLLLLLTNWISQEKKFQSDRRWLFSSRFLGRKTFPLFQRDHCQGKRVYIHPLPPQFNRQILERACCGSSQTPITWMCDRLGNHGLGLPARVITPPTSNDSGALDSLQFPGETATLVSSCRLLPASSWYRTGQFALEIMIHERFRRYQCLTDDPHLANLFYIPYYAGLDVSQYLFTKQVQMRDKLGQRLLGYLQGNRHWNRKRGRDHVLVLGRIVWDFGRSEENHESWGSSLLSIQELDNATKLLIERDVWRSSQMALPYPTGFHPDSRQEIDEWLAVVNGSSRDLLVSFAGALRDGNGSTATMRRSLRRQCQRHERLCTILRCERINCEENPEIVTCVALRSVFCLMPPGDSPTRKAFFDGLVAGCIPVVFSEHTAYTQYLWHLPRDPESYSIFFPHHSVIDGSIDVIQELARIPAARVRSLQDAVARIIPRIIYAKSSLDGYPDAFDIALEKLLVAQEP
ncbi:probable xyloglucan galactosyltransferase GT11 [Selaginella moellendorffii]|uniref:probable xyloglucan galactosyltransferase GT11 n=1 Tax=Selaginella moellendorffii TaxID=88036 RepID=UPI000D1C39E4|nr:probable xyloglucan galactosyltransferase GT11 [Selaginella moellendorffii]|eukprot:XP_024531286.1 probable xyloglucan galactosyltransferase GT11 [Selaginella moellendorffii]